MGGWAERAKSTGQAFLGKRLGREDILAGKKRGAQDLFPGQARPSKNARIHLKDRVGGEMRRIAENCGRQRKEGIESRPE